MSKIYNLKTICGSLKEEDILSEISDFVEISEWKNGEGIDISVMVTHSLGARKISLTWGEFRLIKKLIKDLRKHDG